MQMQKKQDVIEDKTVNKAKDNITTAEDMIGDIQLYEETVHPNFEDKKQQANEILEQHGDTINSFNRQSLSKILRDQSNVKIKESDKLGKNFNQGKYPDMSVNDFCD